VLCLDFRSRPSLPYLVSVPILTYVPKDIT